MRSTFEDIGVFWGLVKCAMVNIVSDSEELKYAIKRIAGMTPASVSDTFISSLQVEGTDGLSQQNIANMINATFVEPLESFQRLESVPTPEEESTPLIIPESAILSALEKLNPCKVAGPDEIPNRPNA